MRKTADLHHTEQEGHNSMVESSAVPHVGEGFRERASNALSLTLTEGRVAPSGPTQERAPAGSDSQHPGSWLPVNPATVEAQKTGFLKAVSGGSNVTEAIEASGMSSGSLYLWAKSDPELEEGIQQASRNRLRQLEGKLDSVIENPAKYDDALRRPSWMNAIMFRTKFLEPGYRDNADVNINVGVQVNNGDIDQAAADYWRQHPDRKPDRNP